jgi:hypothetical protein
MNPPCAASLALQAAAWDTAHASSGCPSLRRQAQSRSPQPPRGTHPVARLSRFHGCTGLGTGTPAGLLSSPLPQANSPCAASLALQAAAWDTAHASSGCQSLRRQARSRSPQPPRGTHPVARLSRFHGCTGLGTGAPAGLASSPLPRAYSPCAASLALQAAAWDTAHASSGCPSLRRQARSRSPQPPRGTHPVPHCAVPSPCTPCGPGGWVSRPVFEPSP